MSFSDSGSGSSDQINTLRSIFDTGVLIAERYRVTRFIARGGMGLVYEVVDETSGQRLALKALKPDIARLNTSLERFKREIRLTQRIVHANVCRIFEAGQHVLPNGRSIRFFTMEFLPGQTLSEYLKEHGPLSTEQAEPIVRQLASGLGAAHRAGVAHRDFKPSNVIMVPEDGQHRAVITDFGLARSLVADERSLSQTLTQSGQLMGTPAYFAPELLEGERVQGPGDFYALGVVVYEMLTGELPFTGRTPLVIALKRLREPAIPLRKYLPDVPVVWDRLVLTCLQRYPKQRFAKAEELLALFDEEDDFQPSTTTIVSTLLDGDGERGDRQKGWRSSIGWVALAVVALAALLLLPLMKSEEVEPIYVAILPPQLDFPAAEAAAFDPAVVKLQVSLALQRIGHRLPGVRVVEAPLGDAWAGSWGDGAAAARAVERFAVDEVVVSRIAFGDGGWSADLSRRSPSQELWQRSSSVIDRPEQWNHALADSLWQAYDSPPRRSGLGARFELNPGELSSLASRWVRRETVLYDADRRQLLAELQSLRRRVPQFFEIHVATAEAALDICRRRRAPTCREAAQSSLEAARLVAPGDFRVFALDLRLALLDEDFERTERALEALGQASPGDVELAVGEATLAWQRGRRDEALERLRTAADRQPLWRVLATLARFEAAAEVAEPSGALDTLRRRAEGDPQLDARWQALRSELAEMRR